MVERGVPVSLRENERAAGEKSAGGEGEKPKRSMVVRRRTTKSGDLEQDYPSDASPRHAKNKLLYLTTQNGPTGTSTEATEVCDTRATTD